MGRAVSWGQFIRFMAMGSALVTVTYYGAYSIGETVDNLIGWNDDWDDKEN